MVMIFLLGWPLEWVPIVMIIIPKKTTNIFKLYIKYKEDINEKPITLCTFAPQKQNRSFQFQVL